METKQPACFRRRLWWLHCLLRRSGLSLGPLVWQKILQATSGEHTESLYGYKIPPDYGWDIIAEANRRVLPAEFRRGGYSFVFIKEVQRIINPAAQAALDHFFGHDFLSLRAHENANVMMRFLKIEHINERGWDRRDPYNGMICEKDVLWTFFILGVSGPGGIAPIYLSFRVQRCAILELRHMCRACHTHRNSCVYDPSTCHCDLDRNPHCNTQCRKWLMNYGVRAREQQEYRVEIYLQGSITDASCDRLVQHLRSSDFGFIRDLCYSWLS